MFETFIVQPIYNVLLFIYSIVPGHDFGVSIIIFTLLIRFVMWPLVKKQMHHTRAMRKLQPEIKQIKKKTKGDKQKESKMMMELYKEREVNPFGAIGVLVVQLPILIALFSGLRALEDPARVVRLPYEFQVNSAQVQGMFQGVSDSTNQAIQRLEDEDLKQELLDFFGGSVEPSEIRALSVDDRKDLYSEQLLSTDDQGHEERLVEGPFFDAELFGSIDLSRSAIGGESVYIPLLAMALMAALLQYYQAIQLSPDSDDKRKLRDILKASADGKDVDQGDINAAMGRNMRVLFPILTGFFAATFPGSLALYWTAGSAIGYAQNRFILNQDVDEMKASVKIKTSVTTEDEDSSTSQRSSKAQDAEIIKKKQNKHKKGKKKGRR